MKKRNSLPKAAENEYTVIIYHKVNGIQQFAKWHRVKLDKDTEFKKNTSAILRFFPGVTGVRAYGAISGDPVYWMPYRNGWWERHPCGHKTIDISQKTTR
jgi:hypothetical protein